MPKAKSQNQKFNGNDSGLNFELQRAEAAENCALAALRDALPKLLLGELRVPAAAKLVEVQA